MLYKQFVTWSCNGCTIATLTKYSNNLGFQELSNEKKYFGNKSGERIYIDLRDSLGYTNEIEKPSRNDSKLTMTIETKNPLKKKMRLRVWGYSNGEYLYMFVDSKLTLKYKTYTIKSQDDELEE